MIVCADDFGVSPAVNAAIMELVERKRISAVSCMVNAPHFMRGVELLKAYAGHIDVGLHVVLTCFRPLSGVEIRDGLINCQGSFLSFPELALNAYSRRIRYSAVCEEITTQLQQFRSCWGHDPDHIDGHEHVQQLPVLRNAVAVVAKKTRQATYVRVAGLPLKWYLKAASGRMSAIVLKNVSLGVPGFATARLMEREGVRHNRYLMGYGHPSDGEGFRSLFALYLGVQPGRDDVFFCHPGHKVAHPEFSDPISQLRVDTWRYLLSSEYEDICANQSLGPNTFFRA